MASAKFSKQSLVSLNQDTIKLFNFDQIKNKILNINNNLQNEKFWRFVKNNITFLNEVSTWETIITDINNYKDFDIDTAFVNIAAEELPNDPFDETTWDTWTSNIKELDRLLIIFWIKPIFLFFVF